MEEEGVIFERFSSNVRPQYGLLAASLLALVFTGLPVKFRQAAWTKHVIDFFSDVTPIIHRVVATL